MAVIYKTPMYYIIAESFEKSKSFFKFFQINQICAAKSANIRRRHNFFRKSLAKQSDL